jgi:hypothetical protein
MLAFSFMMTANQAYTPISNIEETKYKYSDMKEFKKSVIDVRN